MGNESSYIKQSNLIEVMLDGYDRPCLVIKERIIDSRTSVSTHNDPWLSKEDLELYIKALNQRLSDIEAKDQAIKAESAKLVEDLKAEQWMEYPKYEDYPNKNLVLLLTLDESAEDEDINDDDGRSDSV